MKRLRSVVRPLVVVAAGLTAWLAPGEAAADGPRVAASAADGTAPVVVLLRTAHPDDVTAGAMARVGGELKAAGFVVATVRASDNPKRDLESAGADLHPIAAFAIFVGASEGGASAAEIWVSDRARQTIVIQQATLHDTDGGRGSEILAVRAVELLKVRLADFWAPAPAPPPEPRSQPLPPPAPPVRTPPVEEASKPRAPFASGPGAGIGAAVDEKFGAMGATFSPELVVSYGWSQGFSVRAAVVALGSGTTVSTGNGSAGVSRDLALLEAVEAPWPRAPVVPFAMAGAGVQRVHVEGVGNPPYQGHTSSAWSPLFSLGAGLAVPLVATLAIVAQVRGTAASSPAAVQIAGAEAGRVGDPSLLADASLFGTLP